MDYVWAHADCTAETCREGVAGQRVLKDSTIRTVLRGLEDKGYISHQVVGRTYIYRAADSRRNVAVEAAQHLIDRFCGGSVEDFLVGLVDKQVLSPSNCSAWPTRSPRARRAKDDYRRISGRLGASFRGSDREWRVAAETTACQGSVRAPGGLDSDSLLLLRPSAVDRLAAVDARSPAASRCASGGGATHRRDHDLPPGRASRPQPPRFNWRPAAIDLYLIVAAALLFRMVLGIAMTVRLLRASRPVEIAGVRESDRIASPVTLGVLRLSILLPLDWRQWDAAKLKRCLPMSGPTSDGATPLYNRFPRYIAPCCGSAR